MNEKREEMVGKNVNYVREGQFGEMWEAVWRREDVIVKMAMNAEPD